MAFMKPFQLVLYAFVALYITDLCDCHGHSRGDILRRIHNLGADIADLKSTDLAQQKSLKTHEARIQHLVHSVNSFEKTQHVHALGEKHGKRQLTNDGLVAFNAKLSNHVTENVTRGQPIIFETIDFNSNDGYNWKTGNFTAPSSGIYMFSLSLLSHNYITGYYVHGEIVHNSKPVARALAVGDPTDNRDQGAVTVLLQVTKGDTIWVRSVDFPRVTVGGDLFSVFCGYLLYPQ